MVAELQKVLALPAIDDNDLAELESKITAVNDDIIAAQQKRDEQHQGDDDKLAIFRCVSLYCIVANSEKRRADIRRPWSSAKRPP